MRCGHRKRVVGGHDRRGGAEAGEPVRLERAVCAVEWRNVKSAAVKAWCKDFWRSAVGRHLRRDVGSTREEIHSAFIQQANTVIVLFDTNERLYDPGTPT